MEDSERASTGPWGRLWFGDAADGESAAASTLAIYGRGNKRTDPPSVKDGEAKDEKTMG